MDQAELLKIIHEAKEKNVTELDLSFNQLTILPAEIGQLTQLTKLDLSFNQLITLPAEIGQLANLQNFNLQSNMLTKLPGEIKKLSALQNLNLGSELFFSRKTNLLYLQKNRLGEFPVEILQLTHLATLDLSGNQLTALPPEIVQLTSLTELNLSGNQLTALPPEIVQLTSLTELNLIGNQLTALPAEIIQLTSLKTLYLGGNQLTALPPEIVRLTSLTELYLSGNQLTALPAEIVQLTSLTKLYLSNNQLTALPAEIGKLTSLTTLYLSNNQLTTLPAEIVQLTSLTTLNLSDNQLTTLPAEIIRLTSLTELYLSGNQLTALPPEIVQLTSLTTLNLSKNQLKALPAEIVQLTHLTILDLSNNQLTALPAEIVQLTSLTTLDLSNNQLTALPPEIGKLTSLTTLDLSGNQLTALPTEIRKLTSLTELNLSGNQLTALPAEFVQLTSLTELYLSYNQLTALPAEIVQLTSLTELYLSYNQLTALPAEIVQLTSLRTLYLSNNQLTALPAEIVQLTSLTTLGLSGDHLTALPAEIVQLTSLTTLDLSNNKLTALPAEIVQLTSLTTLDLSGNKLAALPAESVRLTSLTEFFLHNNQLTELPSEIVYLTSLATLDLSGNQLTALPAEIVHLTRLITLDLSDNQLQSLPLEIPLMNIIDIYISGNSFSKYPPEIVEQGKEAILTYLRELNEGCAEQWVSKLVLVGEGGVGKTCLLRALRDEDFIKSPTTKGIEIKSLVLPHNNSNDVKLTFNAWDFGGQEIYHATHQFFLTNRSLFILVWNARHGYEQGKLYYWLDGIQARAPESPVFVVATWTDERPAELPEIEFQRKYPQIKGFFSVSNLSNEGILALQQAIRELSCTELPLMGERWPTTWLNAAIEIRSRPEKYMLPLEFKQIMLDHSVSEAGTLVLSRWLHELGDILFFQTEDDLKNLVILKPQWVSEYVSKVLDSNDVIRKEGVFTSEHMKTLWSDLDPQMQEHFLRLMEQFDLSYRTLEDKDVSLVVERLPLDPPPYEPFWSRNLGRPGQSEISMIFRLNTILPGLPTWFIARSHRFTTKTHWRSGVIFSHEKEQRHLGLVQADSHEKYLKLTVRGPQPQNFFALLKDGLEETFMRYPGIKINRTIPCPGHDGKPCEYEFSYEYLSKMIEREKPREFAICEKSLEDVSVNKLLFGIHPKTTEMVLTEIKELKSTYIKDAENQRAQIQELVTLLQRQFTGLYRRDQEKLESYCPSVFTMKPYGTNKIKKNLFGEKLELQLYCEAPGHWHDTGESGRYVFDYPPNWMRMMGDHLQQLVTLFKIATPFIKPLTGIAVGDAADSFSSYLDLMEQMVNIIPDFIESDHLEKMELADQIDKEKPFDLAEKFEGSPLRAIEALLLKLDEHKTWGGLTRRLTPENHYLWLCEEHAKEYKNLPYIV